jgi:hypothetical protein
MQFAPISPMEFTTRFKAHWTNRLGNVASPTLEKAWLSLGSALSGQVFHHDDPVARSKWRVVPLPTGVGKTQGMAFYCAMLAHQQCHPGALIVVRRISDADDLTATINDLADGGNGYAYSHHSGKPMASLDALADHPVLIVTHSAYRNAMSARTGHPLATFLNWQMGERRLVVIDEAIDLVDHYEVTLDDLRQTLGFTPEYLRGRFPQEIKVLESAVALLEAMPDENASSRVLCRADFGLDESVDMLALKDAVHSVTIAQVERISEAAAKLAGIFDSTFDNLQVIAESWSVHSKLPRKGHTLQTSRLIVPEGMKGAVVLDATASTNLAYELYPLATVAKPVANVRTYKNVTIHVKRGHTGKIAARENADERLPAMFDYFNERITGKDALFICHKDVEAKALAHATTFKLNVCHWGMLDGSNEWRDCDTAILYDLHHRPHGWAISTYFALQGVQTDDWLNSRVRNYGDHKDVVAAMVDLQTITDLLQAVNRIRCRRVIDGQGNCPEADIYVTVPVGDRGNTILDKLKKHMPGIVICQWDISTQAHTRKARSDGGKFKTTLYNYLRIVPSGRYLIQTLMDDLAIKASTMKRIIKDGKEDVDGELAGMNVTYQLEGFGKGCKAYFVKE